jgi:hypothetical protein
LNPQGLDDQLGDPVDPDCFSAYYGWLPNQEFETLAFDNVKSHAGYPGHPDSGAIDYVVDWAGFGRVATAQVAIRAPEPFFIDRVILPKIPLIRDNGTELRS